MSEKDPKDTEAVEPEAEATEPVEPAPADEHEPAAAAEAAEATSGDAEQKPKRARSRRKKAEEPVAEEAVQEPTAEVDEHEPAAAAEAAEATSAEADAEAEGDAEPTADADAEPAEEAKPRRSRRRKAAEAEAEEPPPAPKPEPKRKPLGVDGSPVLVRAQARYVRSSARKARLVSDQIRGKSVQDARAILATTPRAVARDWTKLLESAIANAENNHELVGDDLRIARIHADEGPTLKRFRPRAMGRATKIRKRTSHLTILLSPKE
jgi:ribosomal protein L22